MELKNKSLQGPFFKNSFESNNNRFLSLKFCNKRYVVAVFVSISLSLNSCDFHPFNVNLFFFKSQQQQVVSHDII
jgi:hypothetical protein